MTGYALQLDPGELARYRSMGAQARDQEAGLWATAGIVPGAHVADLGCGPGGTLVAMAELVGPAGSVVGVDGDPAAVDAAGQLIASVGLANATARAGEVTATGLEPASVDVAVLRHVLAHNGPTEQAIVDHAASLLRPGGCAYLADIDFSTHRTWPDDGILERMWRPYQEFHARRGNDLRVGLRLGDLLEGAGLEVVSHGGVIAALRPPPAGLWGPPWAAREAMRAAGLVTEAEIAEWRVVLEARDALAVRPTRFFPLFIAIGRRPVGP